MTKGGLNLLNGANVLLGFFFPEICQLCRSERATAGDGYVCSSCWSKVRFIKPPFCRRCGLPFAGEITTAFECANCRDMDLHFSFARSAVVARGVVLDAIHRYKYQRALRFEPFLADLLIREAASSLRTEGWNCIVPVPLHATKYREREFNQSARIAACLGAAMQVPVRKRLLQRVVPTSTQTLLTRHERTANVRTAFVLSPRAEVRGLRIVLVDDVFTTGATTNACARVLRRAGAGEVCVWTVARGI